jgi:hypothetical protein
MCQEGAVEDEALARRLALRIQIMSIAVELTPGRQPITRLSPMTAKNTVWMLWTRIPRTAVRYRLAG